MAFPLTITGISTVVPVVGPYKTSNAPLISQLTTSASGEPWGQSIDLGFFQSFTTVSAISVNSVTFVMKKVGAPTDNLYLEIRDGAGTSILGTSATVAGSSLTTGYTTITFTFSSSVPLSASTNYYLLLRRSGATDASNYYTAEVVTSNPYAGGNAGWWDGTTYTNYSTEDTVFSIKGTAYYFFGRDSTTATTLQAYISTDTPTSWASSATNTGFATAVQALSASQNGDTIHIAVIDGATSSCNLKYRTFDMSTNAFVLSETVQSAFNPVDSLSGNQYGCSIAFRASDSQPIILYNGAHVLSMSSSYSRIVYARRTATNTWTTNVAVDAGGTVNCNFPEVAVGSSNRIHFFWHDLTSSTGNHRSLLSTNTLGTATAVTSFLGGPQATSYVNGGTTKVRMSCGPTMYGFDSADSPTLAGIAAIDLSLDSLISQTFADGTDIYSLGHNSSNSDLYIYKSTDGGVTWGSGTAVQVGTVNSLSDDATTIQIGNSFILPLIYDDGGTVKYNEYTVRTLGITGTASITEAADTVVSASTIAIKAAGVTTDANDTTSSATTILVKAVSTVTEADDTLVANNLQPITGTASITEGADTTSSTATVLIKANGLTTDADDTMSSASTIAVKAASAVTEANDTSTSASTIAIKAVSAVTEAADTVVSTSTISVKAVSTVTEASDTLASTSKVAIVGKTNDGVSLSEDDDTLSSSNKLSIKATSAITEASDTASSTDTVTVKAVASITEVNDTVDATATVASPPIFSAGQDWVDGTPTGSYQVTAISGTGQLMLAFQVGNQVDVSNDFGSTWTTVTVPGVTSDWYQAKISDDGSLIVATNGGLAPLYSTDQGMTWNSMTWPTSVSSWQALALSGDGSTIYASNAADSLVYVSTDTGATWTATAHASYSWNSLATSHNGSVVAAVGNASKVAYSTDYGVTVNPDGAFTAPYGGILMSDDGQKMFAYTYGAGAYAYTTIDGGATWDSVNTFDLSLTVTPQMTMSGDGSVIYAFDSNNIVHKFFLDFGQNFVDRQDLYGTAHYSPSMSKDGKYMVAYSGSQVRLWYGPLQVIKEENDSLVSTAELHITGGTDHLVGYHVTNSGNDDFYWGDHCAISGDGSLMLVGEYGDGATHGYVYTSEDQGATWTKQTGIPQTTRSYYWTAMSNDGNVIYTVESGTATLYKSVNRGVSWTALTAAATALGAVSGTTYLAASADGSVVYQLANEKMIVSTDSGVSWTAVAAVSSGDYAYGLACSADGSIVYLNQYTKTLQKSTNYGTTFSDVSAVAGTALTVIACSSDGTHIVSLGSANTLWISHDAGATWNTSTAKLFNNGVTISDDGQIIYAAGNNTICYSTDGGVTWGDAGIIDYAFTLSAKYDGSLVTTVNYDTYTIDTFSTDQITLTEDDDTLSSASVLTNGLSADASITEANDTVASSSTIALKASASNAEANDTVSSTSTNLIAAFASNIEASDVVSSTSLLPIKATLAVTDANDTVITTATVIVGAVSAVTEANDTLTSAATIAIKAASTVTEANDTLTAASSAPVTAVLGVVEASDAVVSAASLPIKAAAVVTEADDTSASVVTITIKANASIVEQNDALLAASTPLGNLIVTEQDDSVSSTSTIAIKAASAIIEADDICGATGRAALAGSAPETEQNDVVSSTGTIAIRSAGLTTDADDTSVSAATIALKAAGAATEANDTTSSTAAVSIKGVSAAADTDDTIIAVSKLYIAGSSTTTEASDTVSSSAFTTIHGQLIVADNDDVVSSAGNISITAAASITEQDDSASAAADPTIVGDLSAVEQNDTLDSTSHFGTTIFGTVIITDQDDVVVAHLYQPIGFGSATILEMDDYVTSTARVTKYIVSQGPNNTLVAGKHRTAPQVTAKAPAPINAIRARR